MKAGESQTPQFATAEYVPNKASMTCGVCARPISGSYFQIKGTPVCAACTEKIRAQIPRDSHAAFGRAVACGILGAGAGFALYVIFALATGLIIGYVSLAVGFIVGKAMHMGSRGAGGLRYQVVAVLLTYVAVSMSAVPIAIYQARQHHRAETQAAQSSTQSAQPAAPPAEAGAPPHVRMSAGRMIAVLAWLGIASPILDLRDPLNGLIGLVILFVGMRFAWKFTAARKLNLSGPYTVKTAGAA